MGMPVVSVASGGLPVVDVGASLRGTPVTEAASGRGLRVTKVAAYGLPVAYETIGVSGGATVYATLDGATSAVTMSGGNLIATHNSNAGNSGVRSTALKSSGKYYFESTAGSQIYAFGQMVGILLSSGTFADLVGGINSTIVTYQGTIFTFGSATGKTIGTIAIGNVIGSAIDLDNRKAWFRSGAGLWNGGAIGVENPATNTGGVTIGAGSLAPALGFNGSTGDNASANFGASAFSGVVPASFTAGWPA